MSTTTQTVKNWIRENFGAGARHDAALLLARRAFAVGYNAALADLGNFQFDGRRYSTTPEAHAKADRLFEEFLDAAVQGRVK